MDFMSVETVFRPNGTMEIFPKFHIRRSKDLMIRGHDFYAIWDEKNSRWSTDIQCVVDMIDDALREKYKEVKDQFDGRISVKYMDDGDSKSIDKWNHYCKKQMYDNWHQIDDSIVFANDPYEREMYSSHRLPYNLEEGTIEAYDKLISTLYSPEERMKIEWAIGSVVCGDSRWIQKFLVFVGDHGTGKSTALKIIRWLFEGPKCKRTDPTYIATIDAKAMGSSSASFSLESMVANPLVAIQDDTDLSKIEDNTKINSIVSHEPVSVNVKYQSAFPMEFHAMLFLGSNKEVKITDSRSGIIRRLIDVKPTGKKVPAKEYRALMNRIQFELGAIAKHCLEVYKSDPYRYDDYIPTEMMRSTNVTYSWLEENLAMIESEDGISLSKAWASYKAYCDDADIMYRLNKQNLKNELKGYFDEFVADGKREDGTRLYNYFRGFKSEKMGRERTQPVSTPTPDDDVPDWLRLDKTVSVLDSVLANMPAQYASDDGTRPSYKWSNCKTKLCDIDSTKLHFVKLPEQHIFIDFDLKNEEGEKDALENLLAARSFPPTYAEYSKGGGGLHLHYIYTGDTSRLSNLFDNNIEVKVLTGDASLRRRLSYCNDLPIATISGGLPLRKEKKQVVNNMTFDNDQQLRAFIKSCIAKKHHGATRPEVDYIHKALDDAYKSGMIYDVSDMKPYVDAFASNSTHQAQYCIKRVMDMRFKSEDEIEEEPFVAYFDEYVFYDVEVFPNLFVVVWKPMGKDPVIWINPTSEQIEMLMQYKLIGFNNRKYDNHIIYARLMGYTNEQIYKLSSNIIANKPGSFFGAAYNISYTDVFDYCAKKQSLKKWEYELKIFHKELDIPWDQDVPEDRWQEVADYCRNDVEATEAVFKATQGDFLAREILAKVAGGTPNDTTNSLTGKLIFGKEKHPHGEFCYRDLSKPVASLDESCLGFLRDEVGISIPFDEKSILPYFEGYVYDHGKSMYRGHEVGEGGFVYAEPGIHYNVALIDIESMHPNSAVDECLFGPRFTKIFRELLLTRVAIKNSDFDTARGYFEGRLAEFLSDPELADTLAQALKIAINSVYGLTSASFSNIFRDERNIDNIVAKRGALFMIDLLHAVQERGFTVAHIKTDSIKIPNATPEIIDFCVEFAHKYGYKFVHEATYERMCLVNDAVYIARYADKQWCEQEYGYIPTKQKEGKWTATGTQFAVPYVFKTLFSHEAIEFDDMCEIKSVQSQIFMDFNENDPDSHNYKFVGRVGQFTPVKEGTGGAVLYRYDGNKYSAVTGTKGYRWVESTDLRNSPIADTVIDKEFYRTLVDKAMDAISKFGDAEAFVDAA